VGRSRPALILELTGPWLARPYVFSFDTISRANRAFIYTVWATERLAKLTFGKEKASVRRSRVDIQYQDQEI